MCLSFDSEGVMSCQKCIFVERKRIILYARRTENDHMTKIVFATYLVIKSTMNHRCHPRINSILAESHISYRCFMHCMAFIKKKKVSI